MTDRKDATTRDQLVVHDRGARDTDSSEVTTLASRPVKRSFSIAGHRTSISLEAAFWEAFRELCEADGVAMAQRLAEIDRARGDQSGLSGAVRVWVLARYRDAGGA
jgi:predicted DNA-binding ribbon-helix-helix protein